MSDSWDEMRRAKEEQYFDQQNKEAMKRLQKKSETVRKSPITGKPMKQVSQYGVVMDICDESGGVWLDKGELQIIIENTRSEHGKSWAEKFLKLFGK